MSIDSPLSRQTQLQRLQHAVQALAMPSELQLALFPRHSCVADELALDFDNWYGAVRGNSIIELTLEQRVSLENLDALLMKMTSRKTPELWTDAALDRSEEWEDVRTLAKSVLLAFGWEEGPPPKTKDRFI